MDYAHILLELIVNSDDPPEMQSVSYSDLMNVFGLIRENIDEDSFIRLYHDESGHIVSSDDKSVYFSFNKLKVE